MDDFPEGAEPVRKKILSEAQKWCIIASYNYFFDRGLNRLPQNCGKYLEERFDVSLRQIQRIAKDYREQIDAGILWPDLAPRHDVIRGPDSELTEDLMECILEFNSMDGYWRPIRNFTNTFNEIYGTDFSYTTMYKYTKSMGSVIRNSFVKPLLKDVHKLNRLIFVLNRLEPIEGGNYRIKDLKNVVHVDEKWFYVTREHRKIRQLRLKDRHPDQSVVHKSHIQKVMFLAAVGVPQHRPDGTYFDGKIGLWPVVESSLALRGSVNRPAGAEIIKALSLDSTEYLHLMTKEDGVLARIREKMAWLGETGVIVQHDGASPHEGRGNDFHLACAGWEHEFKIEFVTQPSPSPDLNKLDLCLFYSMDSQAHVIKGNGTSIEELIAAVLQQFEEYDSRKLIRAEAILYEVYRNILKSGGSNQYYLSHTNINNRQRRGEDPIDLIVSWEDRLAGDIARDSLENGQPLEFPAEPPLEDFDDNEADNDG